MPLFETIQQDVLDLISDSYRRISPFEVENTLISTSNVSRKMVKDAVKSLIASGELNYSNLFGITWVEKSFSRPVRISRSVIVKPENISYRPDDREIIIDLIPGISFGSGDHPTTRLSVQGIEYALLEQKLIPDFHGSTVLDIGTGSGILAIAALKFGIECGVGTDTDPCAISESKQNARINGLGERLRILPASQLIPESFSLITANLRFPDIMKLFPVISENIHPGAPVVLSGIRPEEVPDVLARYTEKEFNCMKTFEEKNWSGLVLKKKPFPLPGL